MGNSTSDTDEEFPLGEVLSDESSSASDSSEEAAEGGDDAIEAAMNDTEENDNNDDDGEWEDMPDEDMENMEQNFLSFTNSRIFHYLLRRWGVGRYARAQMG